MIFPILRRWFRQLGQLFKKNHEIDQFLRKARGVIHVGANSGQERDIYSLRGLKVIWIEPIPEIFKVLENNIRGYEGQRAFNALVTDCDGQEYTFNVASNRGQSSSILPMKGHKELWPQVSYERTIHLKGRTLPSLLEEKGIDVSGFDTLVMDTQGSELLVLKGAEILLDGFRYIKTEVPDFEAYTGCCRLEDISAFLTKRGYREIVRRAFPGQPEGSRYYDVAYERIDGIGAVQP